MVKVRPGDAGFSLKAKVRVPVCWQHRHYDLQARQGYQLRKARPLVPLLLAFILFAFFQNTPLVYLGVIPAVLTVLCVAIELKYEYASAWLARQPGRVSLALGYLDFDPIRALAIKLSNVSDAFVLFCREYKIDLPDKALRYGTPAGVVAPTSEGRDHDLSNAEDNSTSLPVGAGEPEAERTGTLPSDMKL
jgi:hypothetical protein